MPQLSSQPNETTLRKFKLGTLPSDEARIVAQWVAETPGAAEVLRKIEAHDRITEALGETDANPSVSTSVTPGLVQTTIQVTPPDRGLDPPAVLGNYRIIRFLGHGGMGAVFEAEDTRLSRRVAIKLILPEYANELKLRERFLHEARSIAQIDHPNVVPILHIGEDAGQIYLVMPLLKGETLDARLKREKRPLPVAEILRIGRDVAAGLAAAHAVGLVHRDIKPANIWLDAETGRARILDFGLAKPLEQSDAYKALTRPGGIVGTAPYMAPEQARGQDVDSRTDLFSLGCVLYHAATGQRPFTGESDFDVLLAVTEKTPPQPESLNPELPPQLVALIRSLLEKNPAARPASAKAVADLLAQINAPVVVPTNATARNPWDGIHETTEEIVAAPSPPATKPRRSGTRWRVFAAGVLLLLGVVAFTIYEFALPKEGTVVVEVSDEALPHSKNGELHIYGADGKLKSILKFSDRTAKLPPGDYRPKVEGASSVDIDKREFTITKRGEVTIRVTPKLIPLPQMSPDRKAAESVISLGGAVRLNDEVFHLDRKLVTDLPAEPFRLRAVYLSWKAHAGDTDLPVFKDCDHLTELALSGTQVGDGGLVHLKDCKSLAYLDLISTSVGNRGLNTLAECKSLRRLDVRKTQVTTEGVAALKKALPQCQIVWDGEKIVPPPPTDPDRKAAEYVVSIGGTVRVNAEDRSITREVELPKEQFRLTMVYLPANNTTLTPEGVANFQGCKNITYLQLSSDKITDAALNYFKDCKQLTSLQLSDCTQIGDKGLANFKDCKQLTVLVLTQTKITDDGLAYFKDCKNLIHLSLSNSDVGDKGMANFKDCKKLTHIQLSRTKVGDVGVANFKDCNDLASLHLDHTLVTDAGFAIFKGKNLRTLNLGFTAITDESVPQIGGYKNLNTLWLARTKVTAPKIEELKPVLTKCTIYWDGGVIEPKK